MDEKEKARILDLLIKESGTGHDVSIVTRWPETKEGGLTVVVSTRIGFKEYHYRITLDPDMKNPSVYLEGCMGKYDNEIEEAAFEEIHGVKL